MDEVFDHYDVNGDGVLEKSEVTRMMKDLVAKRGGCKRIDQIHSLVDNFMKRVDKDNNGVIYRD